MAKHSARHKNAGKLRPLTALLTCSLCFGLFICFAGKFSLPELALAGVSAIACTLFAALLFRCAPETEFRLRDVAQGWRVPGYIVQRVAQISWLLLRDLCGKRVSSIFRQTEFRGERHNPLHAARRVLATLYTTAAPNFIVLQIDSDEHKLHFHQLTRTSISDMLQALGAEP